MSDRDEPGLWVDPDPGRPVPFWGALGQDVVAHIPENRRPVTRRGWAWTGLVVALRSSGFRLTTLYRLGHLARHRAGPAGRVLAGLLFWFCRHWYGCAIASGARLHGGLILPHPQGIVIGSGAVVGPWAWIYQNVTIGGGGRSGPGLPKVGAHARIFTGAVLSGPIVVGDYVILGANVVASVDVPSRSAVRGPLPNIKPLPAREDDGGERDRPLP